MAKVVQLLVLFSLCLVWKPQPSRATTSTPTSPETSDSWSSGWLDLLQQILGQTFLGANHGVSVDISVLVAAAETGNGAAIADAITSLLQGLTFLPLPGGVQTPPPLTAAVGTLPGEVTVDSLGNATYEIPIVVPPGRAGIEPKLSLRYDSSAGNGLLGVGWSLEGVSVIQACDGRHPTDGGISADAGFCLDGQRLVQVAGSGSEVEYRTERDAFSRITGPEATHLAGAFTIEAKNGLRTRFTDQGVRRPTRVEDPQGNSMRFEYEAEPLVTGELLRRIVYTGSSNPSPVLPGANRVLLAYEERPDADWNGKQISLRRRLSRIRTIHGLCRTTNLGTPTETACPSIPGDLGSIGLPAVPSRPTVRFRDYRLTYENGGSGLSRIATIQECVGQCSGDTCRTEASLESVAAVCKPATRFTWQTAQGHFDAQVRLGKERFGKAPGLVLPENGTMVSLFGQDDWIGTRFDTLACAGPIATDFNGDGRDDLVWRERGCGPRLPPEQEHRIPGLAVMLAHSTERTFLPPVSAPMFGGRPQVLDANADGRSDFLAATSSTWTLMLGGDDPANAQVLVDHIQSANSILHWQVADLNGDGLGDILSCESGPEIEEGDITFDHYWYWYRNLGTSSAQFAPPLGGEIACKKAPVALLDDAGVGIDQVVVDAGPKYYGVKVDGFVGPMEPLFGGFKGGVWSDNEGADDTAQLVNSYFEPNRRHVRLDGDSRPELLGYDDGRLFMKTFSEYARDLPDEFPALESEQIGERASFSGSIPIDISRDAQVDLLVPMFGFLDGLDLCIVGAPEDVACGFRSGSWRSLRYPIEPDLMNHPRWAVGNPSGPGLEPIPALRFHIDGETDDQDEDALAPAAIGDFDGDTQPDLIVADWSSTRPEWVVYYHARAAYAFSNENPFEPPGGGPVVGLPNQALAQPDLIRKVVDGRGAVTDIEYRPASDRAVYVPASGCQAPARCGGIDRPLVHRVAADAGHGERQVTRHQYFDARIDSWRRRDLGFAKQRISQVLADGSQRLREIEYDNAHHTYGSTPTEGAGSYRGFTRSGLVASETTVVMGAGKTFARVVRNEWDDHVGTAAHVVRPELAAPVGFTYLRSQTVDDYELPGEVSNPGGAAPFRTETTDREVDAFGNETLVRTTHGDGSVRTTRRSFVNRTGGLWRSDLEREEVTDTIGGRSATRVVERTYYENGPFIGLPARLVRDPAGESLIVEYTYDVASPGLPVAMRVAGEDVSDRWSFRRYDALTRSLPASLINAEGHASTSSWNAFHGLPSWVREPSGIETHFTYDDFGRIVSRRTRSRGGLLWDGDVMTTTYSRVTPGAATTPSAMKTEVEHRGNGRWIAIEDALGRVAREEWTGVDRNVFIDRTWDRDGRLVAETRPTMVGTPARPGRSWEYDPLDRPIRTTDADGRVFSTTHAALVTTEVDPEGESRILERDQRGSVVRVTDVAANAALSVCYENGPFQVLREIRRNCGGVLGVPESRITIEADAYGIPIEIFDDSVGALMTYEHDVLGQLRVAVDGENRESEFTYDRVGRVIARDDEDGTTEWLYDGTQVGALMATRSPDGHRTFHSYDLFGRPSRVDTIIGELTYTREQQYDTFGRPEILRYPAPVNGPSFRIRHVYDAAGYVRRIEDASTALRYWTLTGADDEGRVTREQFGNGDVTTREYTEIGQLRRIQTAGIQDLEYFWWPDRNLRARVDHLHQQQETFAYDGFDRLVGVVASKANGTSRSQALAYDAYGNRTVDPVLGALAYSPFDHVGNRTIRAEGGSRWEFDGNGSLLSGPSGLRVETTAFGKPSRILAGDESIAIEYDAAQNRVLRRSEDEGTSTISLDGLYEGEWSTGTGPTSTSAEHRFRVGLGSRTVAQVVKRRSGGIIVIPGFPVSWTSETMYVHDDHLGSPDVVTDPLRRVVERSSRDAWGRERGQDWTNGPVVDLGEDPRLDVGFTGHRRKLDLGLMDMRGRMYLPELGRFASADPLLSLGGVLDLNRYAYVLDNPLTYTDPTGLYWVYLWNTPQGGGGGLIGEVIRFFASLFGSFGASDGFSWAGANGSGSNEAYRPPEGPHVDPEQARLKYQYEQQGDVHAAEKARYRFEATRDRPWRLTSAQGSGNSGNGDGFAAPPSRLAQYGYLVGGATVGVGVGAGASWAVAALCGVNPACLGPVVVGGGAMLAWHLATGGASELLEAVHAFSEGTATASQAFEVGSWASGPAGAARRGAGAALQRVTKVVGRALRGTTGRVGSSFGPRSAGAAQRIIGKILQTGGNTINKSTAKALNEATGSDLSPREWGRGLEALKRDLGLSNSHHGKITEFGHYLDDAGQALGNILEYL